MSTSATLLWSVSPLNVVAGQRHSDVRRVGLLPGDHCMCTALLLWCSVRLFLFGVGVVANDVQQG